MQVNAARRADYKAQAEILKALAHPTRLLIIDELSASERCVCELTDLVGHEMPTVSRHLSVLRLAGIIEDQKRGAQVFYRLRQRCVTEFFRCVAAVQSGENRESRPASDDGVSARFARQQRNGQAKP